MKRSNRLVILVGVLLAVVAFVLVVILLNQRPTTTVEPTAETTVLVATQPIAIGDEVTPDMVETREIDPDAVSGTPLGDPSQLRNRTALVAVPEGAQVNEQVFGQVGEEVVDIVAQLQAGEKAIAMQVDRVTGLDFLVKQGDHVDIVLAAQMTVVQPTEESAQNPGQPPRFEVVEGLENVRTVKTVLQNKRVLYVSETRIRNEEGQPTPTPTDGQEAAPEPIIESVIIVFAGTDADAEVVKLMMRDGGDRGALTVTLRHPQDEAIEDTEGLTIDGLIDRYGVPVPNIIEQLGG